MEERKFSGLSLTVIALLLVVLVGTGVYAYYASQITGTTSVRALEYAFKVMNANTEVNEAFTITVNAGEIEPGTALRVPVTLDTVGSEVDVDYTIKVKYADGSTVIPGLVMCNGTVATDAAAGASCPADNTVALAAATADANTVLTGTLTKNTAAGQYDFYLVWPWGIASEDEAAIAGSDISFTVEVSGKQAATYGTQNRLPYPAGN